MKQLKKYLTLILCMLMIISTLSACSNEEDATDTDVDAETTNESEDTNEDEDEYPEDVQAIIDGGVLKVGVKNDVIGFGYQDPITNEYEGLEITLAEMIADELGIDIEFTAVTAATRTELLDSGDLHCVIATFTIKDDRKESWDFSTPYYTDSVTLLVEDSSGITSLEDLIDKKVAVSSASTSAEALVSALIENEVIDGDDFDPSTFDAATWTEGVSFQQYKDYPTISTALSAGEVDAFCVDKSILAAYNTDTRNYIEDSFAPQDYGVATKKEAGLSSVIEDLITTWLEDGTIESLISENDLD